MRNFQESSFPHAAWERTSGDAPSSQRQSAHPSARRGASPNEGLRCGFTLVELLVVMALIAIVATMAIAFFPNAATAQREANAAQQLQSWLSIAKSRALRDQRPVGLRLWISTATVNANSFPNVVTECQYIEQPDDYRAGPGTTLTTLPLTTPTTGTPMMPGYKTVFDVVAISNADLTNGYGTPLYNYFLPATGNVPQVPPSAGLSPFTAGGVAYGYDPNQVYWAVQPCPFVGTGKGYYPYAPNPQGFGGDYLEVYNNGIMHQVLAVLGVNSGPPATTFLQVWPPFANPVKNGTPNFRIVRGPRVVGTETLTFPDNTFIDLNTNVTYNNPLPNLAGVAATTGTSGEMAIEGADAGSQGAGLGTTFLDILFSPSGQVITPGVATANLNLWVRCPSEDSPTAAADVFRGAPTIVSVFVRSGFTGAYPVAVPAAGNGNDPYYFVK